MGYKIVAEQTFRDPVDPKRTLPGVSLMVRQPLEKTNAVERLLLIFSEAEKTAG